MTNTNKHFYSHVTEIHTVKVELDTLDITQEEREHLARLVDSSLHNTILDLILSELSDDEKKVFLDHLVSGDNDRIWKHLSSNIEKVEDKIKKTADDLVEELAKDIRSIKDEKKSSRSG